MPLFMDGRNWAYWLDIRLRGGSHVWRMAEQQNKGDWVLDEHGVTVPALYSLPSCFTMREEK